MNKREFIKEVQIHAPEEWEALVPSAVDALEPLLLQGGEYFTSKVALLIQCMPRLQDRLSKENKQEVIKVTQDGLVVSDYLIRLINYQVKLARETIFGSTPPPFNDRGKALEWIKSESEDTPSKWIGRGDSREGSLTLTDNNGKRKTLYPNPDSKLMRTLHCAQVINGQTGFERTSMMMYILTGIKPILPSFELSATAEFYWLPIRKDKTRAHWKRFVNVKINSDLTFDEFRLLHSSIRGILGVKRSKAMSGKNQELYNIVQARGTPPKGKGTVKFWDSIKNEWNDKHPEDQYATDRKGWKGVKIAYERIVDKLNKRFTSIPT